MTVYICSHTDSMVYHTRKCTGMNASRYIREVDREVAERNRRLCKICENGPTASTEQNRDHLISLQNASPEDING